MSNTQSFSESMRRIEKIWASWRTGQRKYVALICATGAPLIFILTHIAVWLSEYLMGEPLHNPREFMGLGYFFWLVFIVVAFVGYLEIKTRKGR
jgi:hypothetical protein